MPIGLALLLVLSISGNSQAGRRVRMYNEHTKSEKDKDKPKAKNGDEKPFDELIKDRVVIEGLFTFYLDTLKDDLLMAIKPEQLGTVYLCGETRSQASGAFSDNGAMGSTYPFFFKQVGKDIQMMEKNLRLRADSSSALSRAIKAGMSDQLIASTKVMSQPQDSTRAILVSPDDFFVRDVENLGFFLNQGNRTGLRLDKNNSHYETIKSFPENSEIDVRLHYTTDKPINGVTMQNQYSVYHLMHFSISSLPETDYVPRLADDRIGHFMTMYQDFTNLKNETAYVRFINRWDLKKKYPDSALSEPVEPIVYWVENTVPEEYREDVKEAIEWWNPAFEKVGFKNAIVAKQMPDTADWDPADTRYNVVRWIVNPGQSYAVGPSRANPFTGQIYDADVRFCVDWIRYIYGSIDYYNDPLAFDGSLPEEHDWYRPEFETDNLYEPHLLCNYGAEAALEGAFNMAVLTTATDDLADLDSLQRAYVHSYLIEILAHEVGHTLGFRHNFKASTIYSLEQINDKSFTADHALIGTIMDYSSANIAGPDQPQGDFYSRVPGPFDDWMIEYAYTDFGAKNPLDEVDQLERIASKAGQPDLIYGTDEDAFGWSTRSIDPYCNLHDIGSDPLAFVGRKIKQTKHLWANAIDNFEKDGNRYQKIYTAFQYGWRGYRELALIAPKFVGGLVHSNAHVGDPGAGLPFQVVPAEDQRRAVAMLRDELFAPDAFNLPASLLNRLQPERFYDFTGQVFNSQVDYPLHQAVLNTQQVALSRLYSPDVLGRLLNNVERFGPNDPTYTMYDMFTDVRRAIWSEIVQPENVNSFRRQLQLAHLQTIITIFLGPSSRYPADARSLAGNDLNILEAAARKAINNTVIDDMTVAHFKEVIRQIEAAKNAQRSFLPGF